MRRMEALGLQVTSQTPRTVSDHVVLVKLCDGQSVVGRFLVTVLHERDPASVFLLLLVWMISLEE